MLNKFLEFSLHQPLFVILLIMLIVIGGVISWDRIDIDAFPDVTNVQVMILTEAPSLASVDVEQQITYPIEAQMSGLPYIRDMRSLSKAGLSQIVIVFEDFVDIYFARQLVNERLQIAKENLPEGVEPEMGPISTGLGEIYQYTLESNSKSLMELRTLQDWLIAPQLRTIPGVNEVNSFGGFVKQYHIEVYPEKLLKYDLTLQEVYEAVQLNNSNAGGNFIIKGWEQSYVRSIGLMGAIEDIENIVLKANHGSSVLLKDIALINIGPETRQGAVTRNGKGEVVTGMVIMLKGANSKQVVDRVKSKIPQIQANLEKEDVRLNAFYDRTSLIESCVETVTNALAEGCILVIIVLFIFLWDLRAGFIIALSLPLSLFIAFMLMKLLGLPANLMSLGGLVIALGKIADAGIIVTENIVRHFSAGESEAKISRILRASREVNRPVIFAMLIIIIVFFPLFTLEQVEGKMFKPLAVTNTLALVGALFVGIVIIPVLCFYLLKESGEKKSPIMKITLKVYQPVIQAALKNRWKVIGVTLLIFMISFIIMFKMGTEFMPQLDEGAIAINVVRLASASLEGSKSIALLMESRLLKFPEIETIVTKTGKAEISEDPMGPEQNDIFIMLKPRKEWRKGLSKNELISQISEELNMIPGIRLSFSQPIALRVNELISGVKSDLAVKIFGDDLEILQRTGASIAEILGNTRGAVDIKSEQIAGFLLVDVQIDRMSIAQHKINVADINEIIETAVGGKVATYYIDGRTKFAVVIRFPYEYRKDIEALENILVPSPLGYRVPLGSLTEIKEVEGPAQIGHENNLRRILVECNIRGRDSGGFVEEIHEKMVNIERTLPQGYFIEYGGQFENQKRAQTRLMLIIPLSILLIFLLLYASFGSMRNAFIVILNVPFALVGGIIAMYLTGQYLSVPSSIGFIALFGVAMLDGIVMVSCILQLQGKGFSKYDAIVEGAKMRLRPILMTASVATIGLIPLLSAHGPGAEIQRPLAIVGVGGMFTSTLLTLVVLPTVYNWIGEKSPD